MSTPLRVCIAAENASLRMGGEAILPYHYFRLLLARGVDVHLLTHERSQAELLGLFPAHAERLHFVRDHPLQKLFFRLSAFLPRRVAEATVGLATQMLTQRSQRRLLRSITGPGWVVHQPIPVSPRFPSLLNGLAAPLVIGPLNGGMEFPLAFRGLESGASRRLVGFGRRLTHLVNRLFPGKREAAVVLVANQRTRAALPYGLRGRIVELPENAVETSQWQPQDTEDRASSAKHDLSRFLFMGRLVDWKALDIVLDALVAIEGTHLDVVGDGPMRKVWEERAGSLGLAGRVRFHGWQSQGACATLLHAATALVLPSLYESGGAVVLEAMAAARPVVATAWGGPADYLDATCGILVEPASRAALVFGFAAAMGRLAGSPDLCLRLGAAGRAKVLASYDWERKTDAILEIYKSVVGEGPAGRT